MTNDHLFLIVQFVGNKYYIFSLFHRIWIKLNQF